MRHAICGPVGRGVSAWNSVEKYLEKCGKRLTEILHIDNTLLSYASGFNWQVFPIGNESAIAAFCHSQAVDCGIGLPGQLDVKL